MLKIAVISDLHVGAVARSTDLNPHENPRPPSDGFLAAFEAFAKRSGVAADILIVPGDISDQAHPDEYELADSVIKRVADAIGVAHDAVYPVLGNHDLNWALVNAVANAANMGRGLRFHPVENSGWLQNRLQSPGGRSQTADPFLGLDETDSLYLVRYNSAEADLPDVRPHRGAIQQNHLESLRELLEANPGRDGQVRVFLTHHHPQIYSDPIPDQPDFSSLVNAEGLLDLLREFRFDLVIHGHKHAPRFISSLQAGRSALSILCAGSFSRLIETSWMGRITNHFHLVNCVGRSAGTGYLKGELFSWAYQPKQWIPSNQQWSGISHRLPFGSYPSEPELLAEVRLVLNAIVPHRLANWGDLVREIPLIDSADGELVQRVLYSYSVETGSILKFNRDSPEEFAMVRR